MSLITPKTELQLDIEEMEQSVLRVAEAIEHAARLATQENRKFWQKSPERIDAVLNSDVAKSVATIEQKTGIAQGLNVMLDGFGIGTITDRAQVEPGRAITFDGAAFAVVIPPAPEPEPEPEP